MISQPDNSDRHGSLFHYTTAGGLLGILRDQELWATDVRYLNDGQEVIYARAQMIEALDAIHNPFGDVQHPVDRGIDMRGLTWDEYRYNIRQYIDTMPFPTYVACLCDSGDLLSQWRAYGNQQGYVIEFRREWLEQALDGLHTYEPSCGLRAVRYGLEDAVNVVGTAVEQVQSDTNLAHWAVAARYMALRLVAVLATVKHPGFHEEREWRLVVAYVSSGQDPVKFRSVPTGIVPYVVVPFPREAVVSVRVGPGQDIPARRDAVRRLLHRFDYVAEVASSETPYRT